MHDPLFLAQKSAPATPEDAPVARDLLDTLTAHADGCVGMAANLIGVLKRIIAVDVQGITGKRKSFSTMPNSKIQYFSIQTPGFGELIPDSELFIMFSNTFTAKFEFKGGVDIGKIGRMISEYVLG